MQDGWVAVSEATSTSPRDMLPYGVGAAMIPAAKRRMAAVALRSVLYLNMTVVDGL